MFKEVYTHNYWLKKSDFESTYRFKYILLSTKNQQRILGQPRLMALEYSNQHLIHRGAHPHIELVPPMLNLHITVYVLQKKQLIKRLGLCMTDQNTAK